MFLVGLTGGIASGKSSVAEYWESLGADVIDADLLAREVVEPGSAGLKQIIDEFGKSVLTTDGELNRQALAEIVFSNADSRKKLESITHPLIRKVALERIRSSGSKIVVYVIPLLVESQSDLPFDFTVTVEAPEKDQVQRMMESRGMTEIEAKSRIASQASPAERANISNRILSSNQPLKLLLKDAKILWNEIEKLSEAKEHSNVS